MYKPFEKIIIRTPLLSFDTRDGEMLGIISKNKQIYAAIYIASPILHAELQKLLNGEIKDDSEKKRMNHSLHRYISRMSTRCTPFGLFAGCSVGKITEDKTNILLKGDVKRCTRLDMFYLCTLSQELSKLPEIRDKVRYYPNTTLYPVGNKYRYIEYHYVKKQRIHRISAVDSSSYLDDILKMAEKGTRIAELSAYLIKHEILPDDALNFICELIDFQLIVSELSPSVTGEDFLNRIICVLHALNINEAIVQPLKEIQELLLQLDDKDDFTLYKEIITQIEKIKVPHEEKFLFQVDMIKNVTEATIGSDVLNELQSTMSFLNRISLPQKNEALTRFQQAFYERYEDKEVPLMEVLDPELGIGYPANTNSGDEVPLLDKFFLPQRVNQEITFQSDAFQSLLLKKTMEAFSQNKKEVVFTDDDITGFKENWDDLPLSLYCMFEIIRANEAGVLIQLNGLGGSCGANLLSRFAHTD